MENPTDPGVSSARIRRTATPVYAEQEELFYLIIELTRLIGTQFDQKMQQHQLTHSQWWGLMHIYRNEGMHQSEFAERMQMGRASAGKLLEKLEENRWVERRPDAQDNRLRRVFLTEAAIPVFAQMQAAGQCQFDRFLGDITRPEQQSLVCLLRRMRDHGREAASG